MSNRENWIKNAEIKLYDKWKNADKVDEEMTKLLTIVLMRKIMPSDKLIGSDVCKIIINYSHQSHKRGIIAIRKEYATMMKWFKTIKMNPDTMNIADYWNIAIADFIYKNN